MAISKDQEYIRNNLSSAARYGQLAEECTELAQAALKLMRYEAEENPPRKLLFQLEEDLTEEVADVLNALAVVDYQPKNQDVLAVRKKKMARWATSVFNAKEDML